VPMVPLLPVTVTREIRSSIRAIYMGIEADRCW
jgi:hypothetical protein